MRFLNFNARRNSKAETLAAQPLAISAFLLGAFTLATIAATPSARAQDAATIINQMRAAEAKAQYSGTLFIVRNGRRETASVWRQGAKRRWQWNAPDLKKGDVLVDNGTNLYLYHASENSVTQTQSTSALPDLGGGWKVGKSGGDYVLSRGAQKLTVDGARKILLRFENDGAVYALQNVKFGAATGGQIQLSNARARQSRALAGQAVRGRICRARECELAQSAHAIARRLRARKRHRRLGRGLATLLQR